MIMIINACSNNDNYIQKKEHKTVLQKYGTKYAAVIVSKFMYTSIEVE